MFKLINKYDDKFDLDKADSLGKKVFFSLMLSLPHFITCLVLIVLFYEQWLSILIVGLVLPDFGYFLGLFKKSRLMKERRKKVAHVLTLVVVVFLLINSYYVLAAAGGIHLFLDLLGF